MTHLGTQLSALADGQLDGAASERALAHVASCPECAEGLAAARAARRALAASFEVRPTADLTARLLALGAQQTPPGAPRTVGGDARPDPAAPWADSRSVALPGHRGGLPAGGLTGDVRPRRLPVAAVTAGALGVGLVAVLFALGGEPVTAPVQHPGHTLNLLSRAADGASTSRSVALVQEGTTTMLDLAALTGEDGSTACPWAEPVPLPEGYRPAVVRVSDGTVRSVEVDLAGPSGVIIVTQSLARLDEDAVDGVPTLIGDRTVLVLSRAPWHAVWQSGDVMVAVVAEVPSTAVVDLVSAASVQPYDDGAPARLVRGWNSLVASWSTP